jgi:hypothetical protein
MTTWGEFRSAVVSWIAAMSGQPESCICWNGEGRPVADPIVVLSATDNGDLATRTTEDYSEPGGNPQISETLAAVRDLTLQCRVETIAQTDFEGALHLADQIRLRSMSPKYLRVLNDGGVEQVADVGRSIDLAYEANGQTIHARGFDLFLRFLYSETLVDTSPEFAKTIGLILTNTGETRPEIEVSV